jgi:hypothetical protein
MDEGQTYDKKSLLTFAAEPKRKRGVGSRYFIVTKPCQIKPLQ